MMTSPTEYPRSRRVRIARALDTTLPLLGVAVVLTAVVLGGGGWKALWMAVLGILMVEAGAWRLGSRVMNERRYLPLRSEVERFIGLARELNRRSGHSHPGETPGGTEALEETIAALQDSVDRMVTVAGKTQAEVEAEDQARTRSKATIQA